MLRKAILLVGAFVIRGLSGRAGERWAASVSTPTWTGVAAVLYLSVGATVVAYVLFSACSTTTRRSR